MQQIRKTISKTMNVASGQFERGAETLNPKPETRHSSPTMDPVPERHQYCSLHKVSTRNPPSGHADLLQGGYPGPLAAACPGTRSFLAGRTPDTWTPPPPPPRTPPTADPSLKTLPPLQGPATKRRSHDLDSNLPPSAENDHR